MPMFRIEAKGEAREVYEFEAESEDDARAKFARGACGDAWLTEVSGSEIVDIEETEKEPFFIGRES